MVAPDSEKLADGNKESAIAAKDTAATPHAGAQERPSLPAYKNITPDFLEHLGFSPDIVQALGMNVTGLVYDADAENEKARASFPENFIPFYKPGSKVVRAPANPEGAGPFGRAHASQHTPEGFLHFSLAEARDNIGMQFSNGAQSGMASTIRRLLDLPESKHFVSDYYLGRMRNDYLAKGGAYVVEISFTLSGQQQIGVKRADSHKNGVYLNTRPINDIFGNKP